MSFCIVVDKDERKLKYVKSDVPAPIFKYENNEFICIITGELHGNEKEFVFSDWEKNNDKLLIEDVYSLVKIDKMTSKIYFSTCKFGLQALYYYFNSEEKTFILADDFWEVVHIIKPDFNCLDFESVRENLISPYPLFDSTYIKGVRILLPGVFASYDIKNNTLNKHTYYSFRYNVDVSLSLEEATERMDNILNSAVKSIKKDCGDVQYAVGLSGGLDSRIIPYYAKKNGLRLKSFIIGVKKPHKILLSQDHKNARKLANIFELKHTELEWSKSTLQEKIDLDVKNAPLMPPQFFKYEMPDLCNYDVLLTGGNGLIVGSELPENINEISDEKLVDYICGMAWSFEPKSLNKRRLENAISFLFDIKIELKVKSKRWHKVVINAETQKKIRTKLLKYIKTSKNDGKNNLDIYEEYFNNMLGARNRGGAFESSCNTKRSFSIYVPYLYDETMKWPMDFLVGRKVLKNLIKTKISKASKVHEQNYVGSLYNNSTITKMINILVFLCRGNGTAVEESCFKKCKKDFYATMWNNNKWFYKIFDLKKYIKDIGKCDDKRLALKIWKMKYIIDTLENQGYEQYIAQEQYSKW